jgi:hypothetical protein
METFLFGILLGIAVALILSLLIRLRRKDRRAAGSLAPSIQSFVTSMRAVGELGVFRIMTKEIITASDHGLGDFGKRYLSWLLSSKRITLVIEFDVDFRYDLNDPVFRVDPTGEAEYRITLPPCQHRVLIRDMRIHSEDRAELLPWLMPDLVGRFFTGGFSVEAKNKLIAETREEATRFAGGLVNKATREAQASATRTLTGLAHSLGAHRVDVQFLASPEFSPTVDSSRIEAEAQAVLEAQHRD